MHQKTIYVAITNHGFGHAARTSALIAEVSRLAPQTRVIIATTAPPWLLDSYLGPGFEYRPQALDFGVVQKDSLVVDKSATWEKFQTFQQQQPDLIAQEVEFIHQEKVDLVLADIPPLAGLIAKAAGLPCWGISNFGWDFIYQAWGEAFDSLVAWCQRGYAHFDRLYRLPFAAPTEGFRKVIDVGLTGGTPKFPLTQLTQQFNLQAPRSRRVLIAFGGLGLAAIPYHNCRNFPDWEFLTFDALAPELANLRRITDHCYRPVDFMPLVGRVVSKPGYGTYSEALRLGVPLVSLRRQDFAEAPYLLTGLEQWSEHQILEPQEFCTGDWDFLTQPLVPPSHPRPRGDGNQAIAQAVVNYLASLEFPTQVGVRR